MNLKINIRQNQKIKNILSKGLVPGIIYSKHIEKPISIEFKKLDFIKLYKQIGKSTPITLKGDSIEELVLIHDLQLNPVKDMLIHVDFLGLKIGEEVEASTSIVVEGGSSLQKRGLEYTLVSDFINIKAIPSKLINDIKINVSKLIEGDNIKSSDLSIPEGVKILDEEKVILIIYNPSLNKEEEETTVVDDEEETTAKENETTDK